MTDTFHTREFDELFLDQPIMGVFRNLAPADAVARATRAWDIGVVHVEIPVQTPDALPALRAVTAAGLERGRKVGAGTIVDVEQLEEVAAAGAAYTVSPSLSLEVARASAARGLPHLPGVSTPSEVLAARREGMLWTKAFPASVLGAEWVRAVLAPFPDQRFVATGGMDARNAPAFLKAGVRVVAVGAAFDDPVQSDILAEILRTPQQER
ncbi:bifunctional 4-hydroxy-2-oxoglutarate aldolase/2-dehydro-3-deoxy-phosphogluconate aldolase [Tersicoccus sp. Bi-70]|uniref:bifunctional 4-hydroxy-2-oxoglutarate aldolase/2-dehydro-3-deoxy-phosphogluconate aldolase n=1 Tax=Tersicoccus sp. Bi-70 TaxID=1897634 RepID=UPI0009775DBF|nr:bifunctional 4-hydroxy-2-oxoglutarate aldolase/2-dehydro-3-deoxy-phosphogluconate aldolase [Tersicoccus sp. Bi-70]OMH34477.1 2-dehydro-3-deoxyphosphogluconate aldolase [Tersicoccus sp. Bi-70]